MHPVNTPANGLLKPLLIVHANHGFTLSELLVTVGVMGLVAALTMPAIFHSVEGNRDRAMFKESMHQLNQATQQLTTRADNTATLSNVQLAPLLSTASYTPSGTPANTQMVLTSGAMLTGFDTSGNWESLTLDLNGTTPPNTVGQDRVNLTACWTNDGVCPAATTGLTTDIEGGNVVASDAASQTRFNALMD
jgi:prepilin-type N-terminal cleavage/methylation domain-containing protein